MAWQRRYCSRIERPLKRWLAMAVLLVTCLGLAAAAPVDTPLRPGEYRWHPELAPHGPMLIVISIPKQMASVYRNGVRIGQSTVSTGKKGYETPTGVFTILQKKAEHYSNLYDDAPMPFMQRLTWSGVALHAGHVPGYPASHGCVRLPYGFSQKLFEATGTGMTVLIADNDTQPSSWLSPGWFAPADPRRITLGLPLAGGEAASSDSDAFQWHPERAPTGPVTVLVSSHDAQVVVLRGGVEIGRAGIVLPNPAWRGLHAYTLLDGPALTDQPSARASRLLPGRTAHRWLALNSDGADPDPDPEDWISAGAWVSPAFADEVYDVLSPGATLILTDDPLQPDTPRRGLTILRADQAAPAEPVLATPTR